MTEARNIKITAFTGLGSTPGRYNKHSLGHRRLENELDRKTDDAGYRLRLRTPGARQGVID
jgi:hypothetical protein